MKTKLLYKTHSNRIDFDSMTFLFLDFIIEPIISVCFKERKNRFDFQFFHKSKFVPFYTQMQQLYISQSFGVFYYYGFVFRFVISR